MSAAEINHLDALLSLVLTPLGDTELAAFVRERLAQTRLDLDSDELYALKEALQDFPQSYPDGWWLDAAQSRCWLCLHVDWKAPAEVGWQVQAIARTLGLDTERTSRAAAFPDTLMLGTLMLGTLILDVLGEASAWLRLRGYELLYLDTGGDEYLALPIRLDLLPEAAETARRMNLSTFVF